MWEESVGDWGPGLLGALSQIEDPRKPKGVRHPLPAVLALSGVRHAERCQKPVRHRPVGPGAP